MKKELLVAATRLREEIEGQIPAIVEAGYGAFKEFPAGSYRNKWYQTGDQHRSMLAIGIHSQWIYINPATEVTIIKLSSQGEPLRPDLDSINLQSFGQISKAVNGT